MGTHALSAFALSYEQVFNLNEPTANIVKLDNGYLYNVHQRTLNRMPVFDSFVDVFKRQELVDIGMAYMGSSFEYSPDSVNEVFEVEHNFCQGSTGGSPLHFDRVPALKMVLYLDDTTRANGALRVLPGSHISARNASLEQLRITPNPLASENFLYDADRFPETHLEASAGSLVLLDTYCIHGGGILQEGKNRRTVRAISWARPLNENYFIDKTPDFSIHRPVYNNMSFFHPFKTDAQLPDHDRGSMFRTI